MVLCNVMYRTVLYGIVLYCIVYKLCQPRARTQEFFPPESLLFEFWMYCYIREMSILVLLVPSDADDDDGGGGGGGGDFPTTLPAWQGPRGYHAQGSNIPFGESLTLMNNPA